MSLSMSPDLLETVVSEDSDKMIRCVVLQGLDVYLDIESEVSGKISILRDMLLSLGASVSSKLHEGITHVVSNDFQTENCANALHLKRRPLIVFPSWVFECNKQGMHLSEAPYLLYNLKEELELIDGQVAKEHLKNHRKRLNKGTVRRRTKRIIPEHVEKDIEQLSMAFQDIRVKPVTVRTKSVTLNNLQLMPTPPELAHRRKRITHNIVTSALSEICKRNLRETIRRLGVYEYRRKVDERTKVLVADDEGTLTPNLLKALVLGVRIVREEWVRDSSEKGCWLHATSNYCVERWLPIYRHRRHRGLRRLLNRSCVFFASTGCSLPHETLKFLIAHAGGKITNRISEADVIITHSRQRSDISKITSKRKPATVIVAQWLIDSILKGTMRPFGQYELELSDSTSNIIAPRDSSSCCSASANIEDTNHRFSVALMVQLAETTPFIRNTTNRKPKLKELTREGDERKVSLGDSRNKKHEERCFTLTSEQLVMNYRQMVEGDEARKRMESRDAERHDRIAPLTLRTASSTLNELQHSVSSEEFVNVSRQYRRVVSTNNVVPSALNESDARTVRFIVDRMGIFKCRDDVDRCTRYVIADETCTLTMVIPKALVNAVPIVTAEWACRSYARGLWLHPNEFLFRDGVQHIAREKLDRRQLW